MASSTALAKSPLYRFPYRTCRNISGPEDVAADRRVLVGHAPASSFLGLEDNENVREYLVDVPGKQKRRPTLVHLAIRETLGNRPDMLSILNGGICVVAAEAQVDDKARIIRLKKPSIINGSQTQGELRRYLHVHDGEPPEDPSVKFEIVVTEDEELVAEVSIARNFQNDVQSISIAGRLGQLDELEQAVQRGIPGARLRKSETELSDEYLDTEKLIQVLFALSPESIWRDFDDKQRLTSKAVAYSQKTRCLRLFQRVQQNKDTPPDSRLYGFFLDIAPDAWQLYRKWKVHQGFRGTRLKSIQRENGRTVVDIPDGIVFPILASHSAFVRRKKGHWKIEMPPTFDERRLVEAAADDYKEIADHNPQTMGKSRACYTSLLRLTTIYAEVLPRD